MDPENGGDINGGVIFCMQYSLCIVLKLMIPAKRLHRKGNRVCNNIICSITQFARAKFISESSMILDNLDICRKRVDSKTQKSYT